MTKLAKPLTVANIPVEAIDSVREYAVRAGYGKSCGAAVRFAVVELARRLREEHHSKMNCQFSQSDSP